MTCFYNQNNLWRRKLPLISYFFHDCLSPVCLIYLDCQRMNVSTCGLINSMEMFWISRWRLAFGLFSSNSAFGLMHILAVAKIGLKTRNKSSMSIIAQPADEQSVPLCIWWTLGSLLGAATAGTSSHSKGLENVQGSCYIHVSKVNQSSGLSGELNFDWLDRLSISLFITY